ncbi:hypothetical protein J8I01_02555 [Aeromonas sanarellii]|uniref:Transposase n=1 Tax=Aeromonas sanarellii TaxID=633415 RepID=A0ABS4B1P5_9GAMM|nr:hypothetical protein [Aeromonas sanarellii]MBP0601398.1 hypothetical protein [Aeromonas sanarellii]
MPTCWLAGSSKQQAGADRSNESALVGDPRLAIANHQLACLSELDAEMLARWVK